MRVIWIILLLWVGIVGGNAQSKANAELRVGMELSYPPFEMTDEYGTATGVSVDLAMALGRHLDRPVKIVNIPFDGLIPALKTGKIDVIISSLTATAERRKSIDFSDPYLQTGLCLLVGKDRGIKRIDDVDKKGVTVVVKKGTTGHLYASRSLKEARVRVVEKEAQAVMEITQGKADVFIYDQMSVLGHWQRNKTTTNALLEPFREESWAIGLRQDEETLKHQINTFLLEFRAGGGFEKLGEKYLSEQKKGFAELNVPFVF